MSGRIERTHIVNPEATVQDLMNGVTEWLQYAKGITHLLSEHIDEADDLKRKDLSIALEATEEAMHRCLDCATHAHMRMVWEQLRSEPDVAVAS